METLLDLIWQKRNEPETKVHFYNGFQNTESLRYGEIWVYAQLWKKHLLQQDTEKKFDQVLISLPTGPEFIGAFFGAIMAGKIPVPLVSMEYMETKDFARLLRRLETVLDSAVLICNGNPRTTSIKVLSPYPFLRSEIENKVKQGFIDESRPSPSDICLLQFSSGSTSEPKGVVLTHSQILANLRQIAGGMKSRPDDSLATWLPLFHDMGLIGGLLSPIFHSRPVYMHAPQDFVKEPLLWLNFVALKKISVLVGPDFMYKLLTRRASQITGSLDLSAVRVCMTGSEPVIAATLREFAAAFEKFGFRKQAFMPVYGMAEAVLGVSFHSVGELFSSCHVDVEKYEKGKINFIEPSDKSREIVSCGRPLEEIQIEIRDGQGRTLPEGEVGEIYFRSPSQTQGYWNDPEATKNLVHNGWLKTGDLGFLHEKNLYISGRVKDLIISRGKKIHAIDLERELAAELRFLRKTAVVALPNERVAVAAELRSLRLQNKTKTLQKVQEKISRHVAIDLQNVFLVPAKTLPVTSSGKLQRYKIRQMVLDGSLARLSSYFVLRGIFAKWKENIFRFRFRDSSGWKVDAVKEEIAFLFSKVAGIPKEQVLWDKKIVDYGLDSLKMMELLTELEKKIGQVPIFEFYQLHNLQQVYDLYRQRMYENSSP